MTIMVARLMNARVLVARARGNMFVDLDAWPARDAPRAREAP
jgi:hypothetical protein